jgi:PAS domain S-box-containing protein
MASVAKQRISARFAFLTFLAILQHLPGPSVALATEPKIVVVLYPDNNDGRPGAVLADQGIRATFAAETSENIEIHSEYLDVSRFRSAEYERHLAAFLKHKYANQKVALVIAGLAPALDFALKYRQEVFPRVPVVFCAIEQREVEARQLPQDVIGVPIHIDFASTLDLALHLHPNTKRVYVIAGRTKFDRSWEAEVRQISNRYVDKLDFVYLTGLPMHALLEEVSQLPPNSIIYYLHIFEDGAGKGYAPANALEAIAASANAPIYGNVDTYIGRGLVGGRVFSFEAEGKNAAGLGLRILAGEKPEQIGVQETSANTYMFDWNQLRRWGIREDSLPAGSEILHRRPGFWDLYRWHVIGVGSLCVIQALLIFGLLLQRSSRVRAHSALRESEDRFRRMADTAPVMVWMAGPDKLCTYFNKSWLDFTGRPLEREIGNGWSQGVHADDFQHCMDVYSQSFDARLPFRMEYRLQRSDGEYRWLLDLGVPRFRTDGTFDGYIGSAIDITDEKRLTEELRDNQYALRVLTGRLLQAQETERRRIARELHDDLSQRLALLAVQLDLLSQKPPESTAELMEQMEDLSGQVKQLSSAMHDLSRQLHPTKLEQLGLVAAIQGLCNEVGQNHGLGATFVHQNVSEPVPADTALCLYRITQEALRNVVKHSGAQHAEVKLCGSAEDLCLQIADDGFGFNLKSGGGKGGLGLVSMRERLRLLQGEISIESHSPGGTRIVVRVPSPPATATESVWKVEKSTL